MKLRTIVICLTLLLAVTPWSSAQSTASSGAAKSAQTSTSKSSSTAAASEKIDINSASKDQLETLPGIGSAYSQKIIDGRPYNSKRDLLTRKLVPQKTYDGIQDKIVAHRGKDAKTKSTPH